MFISVSSHKVEISGGLGPTAGKVWRIGVMGNNASINVVSKVLEAFKEALETQVHLGQLSWKTVGAWGRGC